jgi:hypothetical protein
MVYKISNDVNVIANQKENNNLPDIATQTIDPISSIKQGTRNALFGAEATKAGPRLGQVLAISTNILKPAELNYFSNDTIKTESGDQAWMCAICRIPDMHGAVPDPDSVVDTTTGQITIKDWTRLRANIGKFYAPAASILAKGVTSVEIGDWLEVEFQDNTIFANGIIKNVYHKTNAAGYGAPGVGGPAGTSVVNGPVGTYAGKPGSCGPGNKYLSNARIGPFPRPADLQSKIAEPPSMEQMENAKNFLAKAVTQGIKNTTSSWILEPNIVTWTMLTAAVVLENGPVWKTAWNTYRSNSNARLGSTRGMRNNNPQNIGLSRESSTGWTDSTGNSLNAGKEPLPAGCEGGVDRYLNSNNQWVACTTFAKFPSMPAGMAYGIKYLEGVILKGKGTGTTNCFSATGGLFCGWKPGTPVTFRQLYYILGPPVENNPETYAGKVIAALRRAGVSCGPDDYVVDKVVEYASKPVGLLTPGQSFVTQARTAQARKTTRDFQNYCPPSFEAELNGTIPSSSPPPQQTQPQTSAASAPMAPTPNVPLPAGGRLTP